MQYANYCYYFGEYQGDLIPEESFVQCAARASRFLDYYTMGKAKDNAELHELKMACCALAEQYYVIDKAQALTVGSLEAVSGKEIQSESVGSHSRTFRSAGESASNALNAAANAQNVLAQVARQYLSGTGLLYRGRGSCSRRTQ